MTSWGAKAALAIALSLAAHVAVASLFVSGEEEMQIAGGGGVDMMIVGTAFHDAVAAGAEADTGEPIEPALEPVETETAALEPVEPQEAVEQMPVDEQVAPSEPAVEMAAVTPEMVEPAPLTEVAPVPAETNAPVEAEAIEPAEARELEPVNEPRQEIAAVPNVPLPTPRPEMTAAEKARIAPPKREVQKRETAKAPPRQQTQKSAGNAGNQRTNASRSASAAQTASRNSRAGNAAVSNYPGKIARELRRALRYPREAQREQLKGRVIVSFVVTANGSVQSIRVASSSGSAILDQAARETVSRAAPFPRIPPAAGRSSWSFSVPLAFTR